MGSKLRCAAMILIQCLSVGRADIPSSHGVCDQRKKLSKDAWSVLNINCWPTHIASGPDSFLTRMKTEYPRAIVLLVPPERKFIFHFGMLLLLMSVYFTFLQVRESSNLPFVDFEDGP